MSRDFIIERTGPTSFVRRYIDRGVPHREHVNLSGLNYQGRCLPHDVNKRPYPWCTIGDAYYCQSYNITVFVREDGQRWYAMDGDVFAELRDALSERKW